MDSDYYTNENGMYSGARYSPRQPKKSGFGAGVLVGILITLFVGAGIWSVSSIVRNLSNLQATMAGNATTVADKTTVQKIEKIEDIIRDNYYQDEDIDVEKMQDGLLAGMVDSLGDPYSVYYNQEELKELLESTEGIYYGIGAYMMMDQEKACVSVSGIIDGTPAQEAGLRAGDLVVQVDGESTQGLELDDVVSKIRGEEGTGVKLTVFREGETDYLEFNLTRRKVETPTVSYEMLNAEVGYIQINSFDDVTTDQFTDAYATIKGKEAKGLILDLRGNPGGNVDTVVSIARQILPKGIIFYTEDKYGKREEYTCDGKNEIDIPLVVLVDSYSASASEILAGAVKDYGIGKLVGTTTFGKGIVQRVIALSDGTALKLTESSYYTPAGNNIHGIGIEPDVEVEFDADAYYDDGIDNQLEAAEKLLEEQLP